MKLYQTWRNYAAQVLLQRDVPVLTGRVRSWLVEMHADFFVDNAEGDGEARRPFLEAFFDASIDVYRRALREGYPEAQAREITHVQATWAFANHGWGELLEFPPGERTDYFERYREFFERHDCTPEDPLGEFAPADGLPDAPETPSRLDGDYPFAEPGLADGVYVVSEASDVRLSCGDDESEASTAGGEGEASTADDENEASTAGDAGTTSSATADD